MGKYRGRMLFLSSCCVVIYIANITTYAYELQCEISKHNVYFWIEKSSHKKAHNTKVSLFASTKYVSMAMSYERGGMLEPTPTSLVWWMFILLSEFSNSD